MSSERAREQVSARTAASRTGDRGRRRLGEVLLDAGVITAEQLQTALLDRTLVQGRPERLGSAIVRHGFASQEQIARALATQLGLPFLSDEDVTVDPAAGARVPAALAERHGMVAIAFTDDTLTVATADPTNVVALDDLRLASRAARIQVVVVTQTAVEDALSSGYQGFGQRQGDLLDSFEELPEDDDTGDDFSVAEDAPIVQLAESLLREALNAGASDVHVEPHEHVTIVRYRIDGVLTRVTTIPRKASAALLSRLKLMSNMDIAERRRPQDGRARLRGAKEEVDLRASTLPSLHGETMVLRLLRKGGDRLSIGEVGLSDEQRVRAIDAIEQPQGMMLITGPTGSGKTSTLYALLDHLAGETLNIITLEDPIEYELPGVNQTQIKDSIGLSFARALRTVLRQDPDVVMLGEIRDPEAAEIAIQTSLTGHMVFSTLHTNDAAGAIARLRDLEVPSYLLSSALTMVMAQRLARRICQHCAEPTTPDAALIAKLGLSRHHLESAHWRRGAGCRRCSGSGYKGRLGIFEVMEVDGKVREYLSNDAGEAAIRHAARQAGARSLREDGLDKARQGLTTLEEVLRVTPADVRQGGVCPTCSVDVEPDYSFCPWCSTDLRGRACDNCGHELAHGWKACPRCGADSGRTLRTSGPSVSDASLPVIPPGAAGGDGAAGDGPPGSHPAGREAGGNGAAPDPDVAEPSSAAAAAAH